MSEPHRSWWLREALTEPPGHLVVDREGGIHGVSRPVVLACHRDGASRVCAVPAVWSTMKVYSTRRRYSRSSSRPAAGTSSGSCGEARAYRPCLSTRSPFSACDPRRATGPRQAGARRRRTCCNAKGHNHELARASREGLSGGQREHYSCASLRGLRRIEMERCASRAELPRVRV